MLNVWKHSNEVIFRGSVLPPAILAAKIIEEMGLWLRFCRGMSATGHRQPLGITMMRE